MFSMPCRGVGVLASGHAAVTPYSQSLVVPCRPFGGTAALRGRTTNHAAKDKIDAARGKRFALLTGNIALAAREGKDPDFNPRLQVRLE